jgi:hypothetical protein
LTNYQTSGQALAEDMALLGQFSDLYDVLKTVQGGLKLLDLLEKYITQIKL